MREKIIKKYKRMLGLVLKLKLNGKNTITAINAWAMAVITYGACILQQKESEMKYLDTKSRKTMYGALHPKCVVDILYIKGKDGGKERPDGCGTLRFMLPFLKKA